VGVDEQVSWSSGYRGKPGLRLVAPKTALLRYDSPPWLIEQELRKHHRERSHAASPLRGVSTEEVLAALVDAFSPTELDWDLIGVAFVQARPDPRVPIDSPVELVVETPPWAGDLPTTPLSPTLSPGGEREIPAPRAARAFASRRPPRWLREHDEIVAAIRGLSWEGYFALVGDIFRREGYEVFGGEGPDGDVIDMELLRGAERMLVSCQLRGLDPIGVEPLNEMARVAQRNDARGVFVVSDGEFAIEAWDFADGQGITLIDREILTGLVMELTLGNVTGSKLRARVRRLASILQPAPRWGVATNTH
jgi:hypothetical protein